MFFLVISFFSDTGATPFFPEQFAAMPRTSMCLKKWGTERSEVCNGRGGPGPRGPPLEIQKKKYRSCNQNYSGALLVNKISLVFLQSIKVILTLFFMPTILFTNIDADLCNSSESYIV